MKVVTKLGLTYNSEEEAKFYELLCSNKTTEALIYAARHYKKIGTYALDRAVEQYEKVAINDESISFDISC